MLTLRRGAERGHSNHGWLDSRHTFSFAQYYDPRYISISSLRVINEDQVAPGAGFATHSHQDMEIISYVLEGALEHQDSMGTRAIIRPGEVQRMSAGTGVTHSEYNASTTEPVHFLQIWITPNVFGIDPGYEQKAYPASETQGQLRLIASLDGREDSVRIHQNAFLYLTQLNQTDPIHYELNDARTAYVQIVRGEVALNGERLVAGDGATIHGEPITLAHGQDAEVLLFDLP